MEELPENLRGFAPEGIIQFARMLWNNEEIRAGIAKAGLDQYLDNETTHAIDKMATDYIGKTKISRARRWNTFIAEGIIRRILSGQFTGLDDEGITPFVTARLGYDHGLGTGGTTLPASYEEMMRFAQALRADPEMWQLMKEEAKNIFLTDEANSRVDKFVDRFVRTHCIPNRRGFSGVIGHVLRAISKVGDVDVHSENFKEMIRKDVESRFHQGLLHDSRQGRGNK